VVTVARLESTELFVGSEQEPHQVLRVWLTGADSPLTGSGASRIVVDGGATGEAAVPPTAVGPGPIEVGVDIPHGTPVGSVLDVRARVLDGAGAEQASATGTLSVAECGWTMWMVSHFHYDPVWWNTQAAYTSEWDLLPEAQSSRTREQLTGFDLVDAHLDLALAEPDYRFVLAELDYLKPYWDSRPHRRAALRELLAAGRVELVGGTYNEPNTNLTGPETAIRTLVYGVGWQRDVMARGGPGSPATAWQLDVFGHDPQFPSMVADAGLTSTSWARGPHHQDGPLNPHSSGGVNDARAMQFASEFEWIGPDGKGVLTSYMPGHYSLGWDLDAAATLDQAMDRAYGHFQELKSVALTRNVLLPVGTDYTPPAAWVIGVHREQAARYVWPRFVCGLPRDFFAAVRAELSDSGIVASPQTRDMNPVFTGKDVSYIDTKQAQRATENAVTDAEKLATLACLTGGARYPTAALDKAWRQLAFGAHHDAITGSESDEVYLDLLTDWRDAHDLGTEIRDRAAKHLLEAIDTRMPATRIPASRIPDTGATGTGVDRRVVVLNTSSWTRTEPVEFAVDDGAVVLDEAGDRVPVVMRRTADGSISTFLARDIPPMGWRSFSVAPGDVVAGGWTAEVVRTGDPVTIANEHYRLTVDPARGGAVTGLVELATGRELVRSGAVANELVVYEEYPEHPAFGLGPWNIIPSGPVVGSAAVPAASVTVESSALGQRVTVSGTVDGIDYTSRLSLLDGVDRVDIRTWVDSYEGTDRLVRVRFGLDVPGARPVSETGAAVIGRGFGLPDVDAAIHPWTLDNPAHRWFAASATARVALPTTSGATGTDPAGDSARSADWVPFGVAEVIVGGGEPLRHGPALDGSSGAAVRELVVALGRAGVTSTCSAADGPRYGWLAVDSNLPDVRIAVGGPAENEFTAALAAEIPALAAGLARARTGGEPALIWVHAQRPLAEVWVPGADLRGLRALPVLVIVGADPIGPDRLDADPLDPDRLDAGSAAALSPATRAAVGAVVADLDDAMIEVTEVVGDPVDVASGPPHSVALFNRGMPGFCITPDTSMHLSLLRSCSGWPSGTWIDPPQRRLPDGSNFQHQHWTHEFDYALASGTGDWREAELVRRAASYDSGLLAYATTAHAGRFPPVHSLLRVEPEGVAELGALKPAGNPLAGGHGPDSDPRQDGIALRFYEPSGRPARATIAAPAPFTDGSRADVLETPREEAKIVEGVLQVDLGAFEITTLTAQLDLTQLDSTQLDGSAEPADLGPDAEPVQPVPSRYWLHDSGPAPLGYQTLSVHLDPPAMKLPEAGPAILTVTVSSDRIDVPTPVTVTVTPPAGFTADPVDRVLELGPDGWTRFEVTLATDVAGPAPGAHVVEIRAGLPDGQTGYDTALVWSGEPGTEPLLAVEEDVEPIRLAAGESATVHVTVTNRARSPVTGQLAVIGPWGVWPFVPTPLVGFRVDAGAPTAPASVDVPITVTVPADTRPGTWWLSPKVMALGRVLFAPTIGLQVV
jgi:alpha-mannosidase